MESDYQGSTKTLLLIQTLLGLLLFYPEYLRKTAKEMAKYFFSFAPVAILIYILYWVSRTR